MKIPHTHTHTLKSGTEGDCIVAYIDLRGRQLLRDGPIQQGGQQRVTQDLSKVLGHDCLLLHSTVILNGKDDWKVWYLSNMKTVPQSTTNISTPSFKRHKFNYPLQHVFFFMFIFSYFFRGKG